jgi:arylsulfatase A-like enzyme
MWDHGTSLYAALIHVPLIIRFDGRVPAGKRVRKAVSLRDLGATILDLTGLKDRVSFPGLSLAGSWVDETAPSSPAIAEEVRSGLRDPTERLRGFQILALVDDGWHYLREGRHEVEELFRFHEDPDATTNLIGSPAGIEARRRMRRLLVQTLVADAPDTAFAAERARQHVPGDMP